MDRFQEMQALMRIAERQSFTEAAEDLQIPRATITTLIQRMEKRIGTRLLERTTRTVRLTQDGEAHYRRCVRLLADVEEAEGSFRNAAPKGQLRVNLQGTLARHFVVPALPAFLARYPELALHIGEDDRLVDLVREGVDCVLRAGTLQDSSMVGRRVALLPQVTVASPAYLAQHGAPESLEGLGAHRAVNYISSATGKAVPLEFTVDGRITTVQLGGIVSVTGADLYTGSAVAGLGLVQVPRYRVASELADGRLRVCCCRRSHHRRCRCRCCTRRTGSCHRACASSRSGCGIFSRQRRTREGGVFPSNEGRCRVHESAVAGH